MMKALAIALLATVTLAQAQRISPTPACAISTQIGTYPTPPLAYPKTSDRYAVQYSVSGGPFTDARVYISYYGGTNSSPYESYSGYSTETSMSFVSIPVQSNASVQIRVTKLWDAPFLAGDHVSIRPTAKNIAANLETGGTVLISRSTGSSFAGEQFILWWNRVAEGGAIESLAFFLDPLYTRPAGANVKIVTTSADLSGNLSAFDTLDIEGVVAVPPRPGMAAVPSGAVALSVPTNITSIFLGPGAWLQGKLRFLQNGLGQQRRVYGPGVLDVSRFEYDLRFCDDASPYPDQGYGAISLQAVAAGGKPDKYILDGIVITDQNLYSSDLLSNSTLNNVKALGWNGNNDGFELGINTAASNIFVRSGDDSLKVWRPSVTITNATVWQDYNGGVVNLGWYKDNVGDSDLIDGLYVVKTDWQAPANPSWNWTGLNDQNNGVFVSLMVPGTNYGVTNPPVFRNIFVEDPPQVLFSLKILPPRCSQGGLPAPCADANLQDKSTLNLRIENLSSPASIAENSIGFETLPAGYTLGGAPVPFSLPYTLTGSMNIGLTNITLTPPNGTPTVLTSANAGTLGKLSTNGANVNLSYSVAPPSPVSVTPSSGTNSSATYTFTFSDPRGYQDLGVLNVLVNNFLDGRHGCYLAYVVASNSLLLVDDAGDAGGPYAVSLQNSQCGVTVVSATGSGNNFTLVLAITWTTSFAGDKIIYTAARDAAQNNSGWFPLGVARIPGGTQATTTSVVSASPARITGLGPTTFTFTFSDTKGFADLGVENVLVNNALNGSQACYIAVSRPGNVLFLMNDAGTALSASQTLTAAGSVSNSQCTVSWAANPLSGSGNNLSLMLDLGFTSAFDGNQVIYVATRDMKEANSTDWHAMGTQTVQ
jgi:hypothetical protein